VCLAFDEIEHRFGDAAFKDMFSGEVADFPTNTLSSAVLVKPVDKALSATKWG